MAGALERKIQQWLDASVIDAESAQRIRAFELSQAGGGGFRWPVLLALGLGGLMVGAGVLLFVSAHWDELSPAGRMAVVVLLVLAFHIAGAFFRNRFESMAVTLHALGTMALGAGLYLTGQIFHLSADWSTGALLWAAGALAAWALLRQWPQAALAAILVPHWLIAEYGDLMRANRTMRFVPVAAGCVMLAFTYVSARIGEQSNPVRRALVWIGAFALFPSVLFTCMRESGEYRGLSTDWIAYGVAIALSLGLAFALRREHTIWNAVAVAWVLVLTSMEPLGDSIIRYVWLAVGSIALAAWGIRERRVERINLGVAGFALTVLFFYFASVMDKIGRSASLVGLGVLFLVGGYGLERLRRGLVARIGEGSQ